MSQQNFIGIEIGGTKLQLARANEFLFIEEQISLEVIKTNGADGIRQQIKEAIKNLKGNETITAVGVGFGGPVNYKTGKISVSHQIDGWDGFDLKEWLQELMGAPVFIDNDANVAALGEAVHGAGTSYDIIFYMTIGSGIGGGVVINKKIFHGAYPGEVEIGHVRLNKQGDTLESKCSGWAVDKRIREAITLQPNSQLAKTVSMKEKGEARFLSEALNRNDTTAKGILQETADNIAFALSHVVHLFHPEIIIIGGGLSLLGEYLRNGIASALQRYVMKAFLPAPEIKIASLGKNVVPVGALELAKSSFQVINS
jgi:glucokinase